MCKSNQVAAATTAMHTQLEKAGTIGLEQSVFRRSREQFHWHSNGHHNALIVEGETVSCKWDSEMILQSKTKWNERGREWVNKWAQFLPCTAAKWPQLAQRRSLSLFLSRLASACGESHFCSPHFLPILWPPHVCWLMKMCRLGSSFPSISRSAVTAGTCQWWWWSSATTASVTYRSGNRAY